MKEWFNRYKKIKENPRGKAILFFGFYFIFFAVIIAFLRFSKDPSHYDLVEEVEKLPFSVNSLMEANYQYQYTVSQDGKASYYVGKQKGDKERFTFQDKEYYFNGNFFVHEEIWLKSEDPYLFSTFRNTSTIVSLLDKAYFESETTYKSGKSTYHFSLDTNVICQVLEEKNTDYVDEGNELIVSTNKEKEIEEIIFQLNGYCKSKNICKNSLKLEINYDEIGKIEEILNPIDESE